MYQYKDSSKTSSVFLNRILQARRQWKDIFKELKRKTAVSPESSISGKTLFQKEERNLDIPAKLVRYY